MPKNTKDLSNMIFCNLTALKICGKDKRSNTLWECLCKCGKVVQVRAYNLLNGTTRSCGCIMSEVKTKHGLRYHRIYSTWCNMIDRCENKNSVNYPLYGKRGITVCESWHNPKTFLSDMGDPPFSTSLDRIDNNGNYEPSNCRWATKEIQQNNKRRNVNLTFNNQEMTVSQWAKKIGIPVSTLRSRLRRGWTVDETLKLSEFR